MSVLCPLCTQPSFHSIDALRMSLIKAANGPLPCPICSESFLGLDKLTIHLFSHTNFMQASTTHADGPPTSATAATTAATTTTRLAAASSKVAGQMPIAAIGRESNAETQRKLTINSGGAADAVMTAATTTANNILAMPTASSQTELPATAITAMALLTGTTTSREKKMRKTKQTKSESVEQQQNSPHQQMSVVNSIAAAAAESGNCNRAGIASTEIPAALATCDICAFTFRNDELRDMHFRLVHRACPTITGQQPTGNNTRRNSNNADGEFKCHLCPKTFKMKGSLRVHLRVVHFVGANATTNAMHLSICDRIRQKEAVTTGAEHTLAQQQQVILTNSCSRPPGNATTPATFSIGTLTLLPTSNALTGHELTAAASGNNSALLNINGEANDGQRQPLGQNVLLLFNATPSDCAVAATTSDDLEREMVRAGSAGIETNPKMWECDVCAKAFTTKYFLKKHKRLHTGEMPYTCEICSRTFTFQQSYHKHLLYHSDEKPHVCATCGRAFKELSTLHNHERIHSGEKPFKCEVCGKSFRQRVSFLVHTRIHTGVMPYKCEQCQKSFRYKVSQRTHKCILKPTGAGGISTSEDATAPTDGGPNNNNNNPPPAIETGLDGACTNLDGDQISDNFIKAFLESTSSRCTATSPTLMGGSVDVQQPSPASMEIAHINAQAQQRLDHRHRLDLDQRLGGQQDHQQQHVSSSASPSQHHIPETEAEALLSKTIDDIVVESCHKMGIGRADAVSMPPPSLLGMGTFASLSPPPPAPPPLALLADDSGSPSEKLQNMRLYSPPQLLTDLVGGGDGGVGGSYCNGGVGFLPHFLLDGENGGGGGFSGPASGTAHSDNNNNLSQHMNNRIL